ncbi:hypothetical protein M2351_007426 [Azospirillum canadense]|nr:hypothetical protein [Azospirillum canadense]
MSAVRELLTFTTLCLAASVGWLASVPPAH